MLKILITNGAISLWKYVLRDAFEGPKCLRVRFSRPDKNPWIPWNFSPSKILGYTVHNVSLKGNV